MDDIIREFLIETHENLATLDLDLTTLERDPDERDTLARVFRTLHTVKGTSGFLGLIKLQSVGHAGENLLSQIRAGELSFNSEIATALLGVVDAIRTILASLEASENEGEADYTPLIKTLERLSEKGPVDQTKSPSMVNLPTRVPPSPPPPPPAQSPPTRVAVNPITTSVVSDSISLAIEPEAVRTDQTESRAPAVADTSVRVDIGLLDKLMTLVGELVLARNQVMQFSSTQNDTPFHGTVQRLNLLTTELQAGVMKTRMQPIGNLWGKFPRVVRDLALACGKQVRLEMDGQGTELDRTIMEAIRDPLTHMVRNAVDHGIETPAVRQGRGKPPEGRLRLHASHEGGTVVIVITDDGGGIDPARVRAKAIHSGLISAENAARMTDRDAVSLVFLPGFSTTDRVTQFSGRGVGMDVVRTNIEKIGGTVEIESRISIGTTVTMKIPLTLAIIPALLVTSGGDRYAIPQASLLELVRLEGEQVGTGIEFVHNAPVYRLRGNLLPLVYLNRLFHKDARVRNESELFILVVQADDRPFGLVVDAIHDTEEIVVKPLQHALKGIPVFAGATILGDGRVALILDVRGVAQTAGVVSAGRERTLTEKPTSPAGPEGDRQRLLLVATPGGRRVAIPLSLVSRLEEFSKSAVERVGGQNIVPYRDGILPLVSLARLARKPAVRSKARLAQPGGTSSEATIRVVVSGGMDRPVGLVVGRILDIVDETVKSRTPSTRPGVMYSAIVQGRATEFLDVEGIIRTTLMSPAAGVSS